MEKLLLIIILMLSIAGCSKKESTPLPTGYNRIERSDSTYVSVILPDFSFLSPASAKIDSVNSENSNDKWFNIIYPQYNARIYCSYNKINNRAGLRQLLDDSYKFAYSHTLMADGIKQSLFSNSLSQTYGIIYEIEGNVATPIQFFLTDSTSNFFRASLYYDIKVNEDSVAPVTQFIKDDIVKIMESFEWK